MSPERKPPIDPVRWQPPPVTPLPELARRPQSPSSRCPATPRRTSSSTPTARSGPGLDDGRILRIDPDGASRPSSPTPAAGRWDCGRARRPTAGLRQPARPAGARPGHRRVADAGRARRRPAAAVLLECHRNIRRHNLFHRVDQRVHLSSISRARCSRRAARGGLFRRRSDGTVTPSSTGLYFTNGVTPTADGSALVFAETLGRRLSKYWLTGPQAGR